jgi:acetyl-CoA synthetase
LSTARAAVEESPTVERVFVVNVLAEDLQLKGLDERFLSYTKLIELFGKPNPEHGFPEATAANDPAIILYTSGTTGKPKGIAHVHCGFPIKAAQDMAFGTDVGKGTRISWVTDIGWMMGPWLIYGALINGATMVLYDGSPDFPAPDRMWEFSAKHKVEILGISPTLVRLLATKGDDLPKKHDLSSLRAFASTGEPWNPAPWWWLFEKVGDSKLPIINYSGGTEISGGILMGNPLLPQKPGSFPAPCPGMAADILNENGESVDRGEVGELAIRDTWIGMARGFWEEPERYLKTYWNRYDGIWVHGDFAMQDEEGHWYILGRSDDTLKVAGKRVGPAEVESLLVADKRVAEAAVIGIPHEIKGTAMIAFVVLAKGSELSTEYSVLSEALKSIVARDMGKPLTPSRIYFVSKLPKTRNAKVMRRVIRSPYLGEDPGDLSALEDTSAVEDIAACGKSG